MNGSFIPLFHGYNKAPTNMRPSFQNAGGRREHRSNMPVSIHKNMDPTEATYPFEPQDEPKMDSDHKEDFTRPLPKEKSVWIRMAHSFKRQEQPGPPSSGLDPEVGIPHAGDTSQLHRKLKSRHLQMIAIGGAIGAGLFIGSGKALATGGPGAVILDFALIGMMLFCTINALGELATLFPIQGISSVNRRLI